MSEKMVSGKLTGRERDTLVSLAARLRKLADAIEYGESGYENAATAISSAVTPDGNAIRLGAAESEAVLQLYALITEE